MCLFQILRNHHIDFYKWLTLNQTNLIILHVTSSNNEKTFYQMKKCLNRKGSRNCFKNTWLGRFWGCWRWAAASLEDLFEFELGDRRRTFGVAASKACWTVYSLVETADTFGCCSGLERCNSLELVQKLLQASVEHHLIVAAESKWDNSPVVALENWTGSRCTSGCCMSEQLMSLKVINVNVIHPKY